MDGEEVGVLRPEKLDKSDTIPETWRERKLWEIVSAVAANTKVLDDGTITISRQDVKDRFNEALENEPGKDEIPSDHTKNEALRKGLKAHKTKGRIDYTQKAIVICPTPTTPLAPTNRHVGDE